MMLAEVFDAKSHQNYHIISANMLMLLFVDGIISIISIIMMHIYSP